MDSTSTPPNPLLTAEENENYKKRIDEAGRQLAEHIEQQDSDPVETERLDHKRKKIYHEYMHRLIDNYASKGMKRLPYVGYMDTGIYDEAQTELNARLDALGIKSEPKGVLPEGYLFADQHRAGAEDSYVSLNMLSVYSAADGECELKEGRHSRSFYKIRCGPKLCRTKGGKSCTHGLVVWTGGPPPGWRTGRGWKEDNPFQGVYQGDSPPQDMKGNVEIDKSDPDMMDLDD